MPFNLPQYSLIVPFVPTGPLMVPFSLCTHCQFCLFSFVALSVGLKAYQFYLFIISKIYNLIIPILLFLVFCYFSPSSYFRFLCINLIIKKINEWKQIWQLGHHRVISLVRCHHARSGFEQRTRDCPVLPGLLSGAELMRCYFHLFRIKESFLVKQCYWLRDSKQYILFPHINFYIDYPQCSS